MTKTTKPPRGRGRPAIDAGGETVTIQARASRAQRDKYLALGGSEWLRRMIDKAPRPQKDEPEGPQ